MKTLFESKVSLTRLVYVLSHIQSLSSEHFQFCGLNQWPDNHDTQFQINFWAMTIISERIRRKYNPPNRWKSLSNWTQSLLQRKTEIQLKFQSFSFPHALYERTCPVMVRWRRRLWGKLPMPLLWLSLNVPVIWMRAEKMSAIQASEKTAKSNTRRKHPNVFSRRRFSNLTGDFPFGCWGALPA